MKRELKRKQETPADFTARNLISSLDNQLDELNKNNFEIEAILGLIQKKTLSNQQEENVKDVLNDALELSSNVRKSLKENF